MGQRLAIGQGSNCEVFTLTHREKFSEKENNHASGIIMQHEGMGCLWRILR